MDTHRSEEEEQWQARLRAACANYGWGPKEGPITFEREENGWRLGNGVVVTVWGALRARGGTHPRDPERALTDIEQDIAAFAQAHEMDRP